MLDTAAKEPRIIEDSNVPRERNNGASCWSSTMSVTATRGMLATRKVGGSSSKVTSVGDATYSSVALGVSGTSPCNSTLKISLEVRIDFHAQFLLLSSLERRLTSRWKF